MYKSFVESAVSIGLMLLENPVVSTLMRKANLNLALQREDSLYIARKESTRLEAARKASSSQSQSRHRRQFQQKGDSNDDYSTSTLSVADSQITRIPISVRTPKKNPYIRP
jgi:hypothetical protein